MKIIICGKGASGKDFLKRRFIERGFKQSVTYTTRPPRPAEKDGIDYHFIDETLFKEMIDNGDFREWNIFGDMKWHYGTTVREFNEASIFIMSPSGIRALTPVERKKCFVIYIDISEEIRRVRLNERKDLDDPERRIKTDIEDFKDFSNYDLRMTNHDF
jgi:guanylate kinase